MGQVFAEAFTLSCIWTDIYEVRIMNNLIVRLICNLIISEFFSCFCITHMCIIVVTLYSKTCLGYLKCYIPPLETPKRTKTVKPKQSNFDFMDSLTWNCIELMILFRILRSYSDTTALFTIAPGFWVVVVCNYVLIKLGGRVPLLLYFTVAVFNITIPTIIFGELPQLGKSHTLSKNLIKYWKDTAEKKKSLRRRQVNSLQTVGCWRVGNIFVINEDTFAEYFQRILIHSADETLLL